MNCHKLNKDIQLITDGTGIVIYSNEAMTHISEGEDYFMKEFSTPQKVAEHIKKGDIIGFNTGSAGTYNLHIRGGYPSEKMLVEYPIAIRLALNVIGNKISFIDLYWLMEWSDYVPEEQTIDADEGIYHLTVLTGKPSSGILGDNQDIYIYLNKLEEMPDLKWDGVPFLY